MSAPTTAKAPLTDAEKFKRKQQRKLNQKFKNIPKEMLDVFEHTFKVFDKDNSGHITAAELHKVMTSLGKNPSEAECKEMLLRADKDNTGTIDFKEFAVMMHLEESDKIIKRAFDNFDVDKNGYVDHDEFRKVMAQLGTTDPAEVEEMIKECDANNDGKINFKEFKAVMG